MVSATGEATNASEITAPVAPSPNEIPEEDPQQEFEAAPRTDEGVFREIDSLAQDVRAKEQRSFLRGATSHRLHVDKKADIYARADMLDEDVKKKLAMKYSAAVSRPGAFDGDDRRSSTLSKPSYSQKERLAHVASQRHEEEQKRRRDIENTGPVIGPENEEDPLDDLQLRMNIFIDETNKEDKDEQKEQRIQQRRKRYRLLAATLIGLVAIVALLGVVIIGAGGSSTGDDMDSSDSGESFVACYSSSNETMQSYLYQELRSLLVAQHSELEASISTPSSDARKSLCWLAHDDALVIQVRPWWEDYWVLQRFSLGLIYFHFIGGDSATGGPVSALSTSNWLTATPICQWTFLRCGGSSGDEVTKLLFHSKTLSGSIPSQLALLTKLVHIEFTANLLIGTIPEEIWTMSQLELFKIDLNELTGTLSSELANLDRLQQLSLGSNQLTGNLPEMASLTNMERLDIYFSKMVGPFPNISGWNNLEYLKIGLVQLNGTLPTFIGTLSKLTNLEITDTLLSGALPSEMGKLLNLRKLNVGSSVFTGNIPSELGSLYGLTRLQLSHSKSLTGTIPSELGRLSDLESLALFQSFGLLGTMPSEICILQTVSLAELVVDCDFSCACCTSCYI